MSLKFVYDDGGRADAGYRGYTGDCVIRAIAIATQLPYADVYDAIHAEGKKRDRGSKKSGARNGVFTRKAWFAKFMQELGFTWYPIMGIGTGCTNHLCHEELMPKGRLILSLSRHYTAWIDGVLRDTYDCSRDGKRCVYGYWKLIRLDRSAVIDRLPATRRKPPRESVYVQTPPVRQVPCTIPISKPMLEAFVGCEWGAHEDGTTGEETGLTTVQILSRSLTEIRINTAEEAAQLACDVMQGTFADHHPQAANRLYDQLIRIK